MKFVKKDNIYIHALELFTMETGKVTSETVMES